MNITILNIHIVNSGWMQAIIHFVHKTIQFYPGLICQLVEYLTVKIVFLCEPDIPNRLLILI